MITIDNKLYITEDVNKVVVSFAKQVVLRKLLIQFSFTLKNDKKRVSELITAINFYNGDIPDYEQQEELLLLIIGFIKECKKEERTSLYFWMLNEKYLAYLDNYNDEEEDSLETFRFKFGRELAYKLYEPETSELEQELIKELQNVLISFASEFDFSVIDKSSIIEIMDTMDYYCQ